MILARNAVDLAAQADHYISQGAVIHIETALHKYSSWIDTQRVALLDMVVDHGAAEVVSGSNRVHISREMEVDVLHRKYLSVSAAGSSSLDSENRSQ